MTAGIKCNKTCFLYKDIIAKCNFFVSGSERYFEKPNTYVLICQIKLFALFGI